jgi:ribonuclease HI
MRNRRDVPIKDSVPLKQLSIYTDGASRGNPGEAGAGVIIYNEHGELVKKVKRYLGTTTNNVAEYSALIIALEEAQQLQGEVLHLFSDSELMVKQLNGIYKVKDSKMKVLASEARKLLSHFMHYTISAIERKKNKEADTLANLAIDERS